MGKNIDLVLVNPGDRRQIYQDLGNDYSAIEPPFWIAVIAAYLRNRGLIVHIIDANALNLSPKATASEISNLNPLLSAVIVYGSQPSASTQNMTMAGEICKSLKELTDVPVAIGGLHPSALPARTLSEESVDFVIEGEGPYSLESLIYVLKSRVPDYSRVPGLWYFKESIIQNNLRAELIKDLDEGLPVAAWDLLPMDKYKAHNWHCFDDIENRMSYAAIYTSLGCPYHCVFCCINALFGKPGIRYRSPKLVINEIDLLVNKYGIKNIKVVDELFVLEERHYMKIVDLLIERQYGLNLWVYARIDTIKEDNLEKMKKAGINWIALGIESANSVVRDGSLKQMKTMDIRSVVRKIKDAGIRVMGNFIFGLPDDTLKTMEETLDLAKDLNCEFVNFYCAMAYPGSKLYKIALEQKWDLPRAWHAFSQHSYEASPLPTKYLSANEVLRFRDNAFHGYFENPHYLHMLSDKFGEKVRNYVDEMTKVRLRRRLLGQ